MLAAATAADMAAPATPADTQATIQTTWTEAATIGATIATRRFSKRGT